MSAGTSTVWSAVSRELADTAERAAASIVQVHGRSRPASGIVWAAERVLSTSHSVEWEDGVRVRRDDGTVMPAEVVGHDPASDLVVLKVPGLDAAPLTHVAAPLRAGELALVAGRGWSGHPHARLVAISGVAGPVQTAQGPRLERVFALPLSPFAGFSGSALIAADGTLAGIATAGLMRGRGLALPIDVARPIAEAIEKHGGIKRGYLGVVTQPVRISARQRGELPVEHGLLVLDVSPDSPAETAGILVGDIIVGAAGGRLSAPEDLLAVLNPERVGQALPLEILRGAAPQKLDVTVGERLAHR